MKLFNNLFRRMYPEGICLSLIKDFDTELKGEPYSILPLCRLAESNDLIAQSLSVNSDAKKSAVIALAGNMLTRASHVPKETEESITRVGLPAGDPALVRAVNASRVALQTATSTNAVKVCLHAF